MTHARRYPRLILINGVDRDALLYFTPGTWLDISALAANVLLILKHEWDEGEGLEPPARGWIDTERLNKNYESRIHKKLAPMTTRRYANDALKMIAEFLAKQRSILPPIFESKKGLGYHLVADLHLEDRTANDPGSRGPNIERAHDAGT